MRRALDVLLALACAALLITSALFLRHDRAARRPAVEFVRKFNVELRRPEVAHTVGYAPTPDWSAELVADAALRDAFEPVNLTEATPQVREAWIAAAAQVDDELRYARGSLLDAVAVRPGWPFYQSMLGQTAFTLDSRAYSPELIQKHTKWSLPLLYAAHAAPAALPIWKSLAAAYLQTWPLLHHPEAPAVFKVAFSDPEFVRIAFGDAANLLGSDAAIRFVPDTPRSLRAAFTFFAQSNDTAHAWPLQQRWERAEWNERVSDLADIERHSARGDVDDVRFRCYQWISRHSVWDFDSPAAHAQAARVLELWPGGRRSAWSNDPLAEIARYLLSRNGDPTRYAAVVARMLDSFSDVPASTVATVHLGAGDVAGAERIAQSAEDAGTLDWAPYLLALTRHYQSTGEKQNAEEAFARIPVSAQGSHEALLVSGQEDAGRSADAPLICDRQPLVALHGQQTVRVHITVDRPTLVDVGLNRARSGTLLVESSRDIDFPITGYRDQTLWARPTCGSSQVCVLAQPSM